jgi:hypothetical protein
MARPPFCSPRRRDGRTRREPRPGRANVSCVVGKRLGPNFMGGMLRAMLSALCERTEM